MEQVAPFISLLTMLLGNKLPASKPSSRDFAILIEGLKTFDPEFLAQTEKVIKFPGHIASFDLGGGTTLEEVAAKIARRISEVCWQGPNSHRAQNLFVQLCGAAVVYYRQFGKESSVDEVTSRRERGPTESILISYLDTLFPVRDELPQKIAA